MEAGRAPVCCALLFACTSACVSRESQPMALDGPTIYRERRCHRCHGADRLGTEMAPPLTGLSEHWSADALARYVEDPASFRERDPRLRELVQRYRGRLMRAFPLPEAERRTLALWLLQADATKSAVPPP